MAYARGGHALEIDRSRGVFHFLARVSGGTGGFQVTCTPAESGAVAVFHAGVGGFTAATFGRLARQAKVREVGHAHVLAVAAGPDQGA